VFVFIWVLFLGKGCGRSYEEAMQSELVWSCFSTQGGT